MFYSPGSVCSVECYDTGRDPDHDHDPDHDPDPDPDHDHDPDHDPDRDPDPDRNHFGFRFCWIFIYFCPNDSMADKRTYQYFAFIDCASEYSEADHSPV